MAWVTSGFFDGARATISPSGSPFTYQNTTPTPIVVIVSLGTSTISLIEFSRDGSTWDTIGLLAGTFPLNPNDRLRVTYAVGTPTMTYYPM
jgi:hypothetical protein